jgi:N-acetylneuraminic acid mutarotase
VLSDPRVRGGRVLRRPQKDLLIANYSVGDDITRIELSADGSSVTSASRLIGGFNDPLPLAPRTEWKDLRRRVRRRKLYAFGGSTAPFSGAVANAAVFNPSTGEWTSLPPRRWPRGGATAKVLDGKIYVVGGMGGDGVSLASVEVFDPATSGWKSAAPMTTRRDNPGSAVLDGDLYVFGEGPGTPMGPRRTVP